MQMVILKWKVVCSSCRTFGGVYTEKVPPEGNTGETPAQTPWMPAMLYNHERGTSSSPKSIPPNSESQIPHSTQYARISAKILVYVMIHDLDLVGRARRCQLVA